MGASEGVGKGGEWGNSKGIREEEDGKEEEEEKKDGERWEKRNEAGEGK